jgi:hypothetical protein
VERPIGKFYEAMEKSFQRLGVKGATGKSRFEGFNIIK